jgi:hypothetical protein
MDNFACFEIHNAYSAWLDYVSKGLQASTGSPPSSESGGISYEAAANAAQGINEFVKACHNPPPFPPGATQQKPSDDCGRDVECQRAELQKKLLAEACAKNPNYSPNCPQEPPSPFLHIGTNILDKFQGCSSSIGQQASKYLISNYSW